MDYGSYQGGPATPVSPSQYGAGPPHSPYPPPPPSATAQSMDPADLLLQHFPEASKLSREDLDELLRSPEYFDSFFGTLPQTRALYASHEQALRQNQELTDKNLALRERHEALKAETQRAFDDAISLQQRWHSHIQPAQQEVYKRFTPNVQLARLRTAAYEQDRLSEHLISSLQEGTLSPDEFAKQFKEIRRLYYRRAGQVDKFNAGQVEWRD